MIDKFAKREHCLYCEKKMEAKNRNKKFCSDKCRVYFGREKSKDILNDISSVIIKAKPSIILVEKIEVKKTEKVEVKNDVKKYNEKTLSRADKMKLLRK